MQVDELFRQVNAAYRGSDDDAPAEDTPDFDQWLLTANRLQRKWGRDPKNEWSSLWEDRELGTVAAGTQTYELDDEFTRPSDTVIVTTTTGNQLYYKLIKPQERVRAYRSAYISGRDPKTLTFVNDFNDGDSAIGGTISLGAYYLLDDLTASTDFTEIDDPDWLVMAMASELAGNENSYSDKAVDLNTKADELYANMALANRKGTYNNPRTSPTNVSNIPTFNRSRRHGSRR